MEARVRKEIPENGLNFIDAHFFSLPSQGNIYTLSPLTDAQGYTKLLVASLQRKIYCLEYRNGKPCMREVPFTYIPAGAEIVSIDAVNRSVIQEDFIIGITIIKKEDGKGQQSQFFNIYSDWDLNSDSALEVVSQNCLTLNLDFVPYYLCHTQTNAKSGWETVWLLSGSDHRIHVYHSDEVSYQEEDEDSPSFPEFSNLTQVTLWMDILYSHDKKSRVSAVGGEGGKVEVFGVTIDPLPRVTSSQSVSWDYPVASVNTFHLKNTLPVPKFLKAFGLQDYQDSSKDVVHIAVCTALESCIIYRDFLGSRESYFLPESIAHDAVLCCTVCDVDHDGKNEVLIGTYGQVVLVYKLNEEEEQQGQVEESSSWRVQHTIKLPCPVLSIAYCDVTGDGCFELIIMTTAGIHIFQHDPRDMAALVLRRLRALTEHEKFSALGT